MKYGICGGPELAANAREAGFEYLEWSVAGLLKPMENEAAFAQSLEAIRASGLPCPVLNNFVPASLKITGPTADLAALHAFVSVAFARAREAGVTHIVFGSGGARRVPEGFDRDEANRQIETFLNMAAPLAQANGVTIAIEPLNPAECNILTTLAEGAALVKKVNHPAVQLLVDSYHLLRSDNVTNDVETFGGMLAHVHVATKDNRMLPGSEPCDLAPFFQALCRGGYNGRVSFEGKIHEPGVRPLAEGLAAMKALVQRFKTAG